VLSYVPLIVILWGLGGTMVVRGTLTLGELLAYTQYVLGLVMPVTRFFRFNMDLQAGYAALDRIYEILDTEPDIRDAPDARPAPEQGGQIVFDHVSLDFREPPAGSAARGSDPAGRATVGGGTEHGPGRADRGAAGSAGAGGAGAGSAGAEGAGAGSALAKGGTERTAGRPNRDAAVALEDVSFSVQPGERVAVVGPSGAGKSSVAHLLLRFYDPTAGQVRLADRPLFSYTLDSLRRRVAYVAQEPFLFGTTVRDNITLDREVSGSRLQEAVHQAAVDEFLGGLDQGLGSPLEPGATNLSGGQRQRIALARALCRDAPIYVLDEATSALDPGIERQVVERLRPFFQGRTALIIAHRLAWLDLVDRVLVFAEGRLVEQGTREELLARKGLFHALSMAQGKER
jgi:ABC-type multidrug transport system fused ATPase/permease subunit